MVGATSSRSSRIATARPAAASTTTRRALLVLVHQRKVYGLGEADRAQWKAEPIAAPLPARPLENCLAGPGLMAWILGQKYCNHLPLYRQQVNFEREGLALPR
jgi:transposase